MDYKEFDNIETDEIKKDISDTQIEIAEKEAILKIYDKTKIENKTQIYFLEGGIHSRKKFIGKLKAILAYRGIK